MAMNTLFDWIRRVFLLIAAHCLLVGLLSFGTFLVAAWYLELCPINRLSVDAELLSLRSLWVVVGVALLEELIFRGLVLRSLLSLTGRVHLSVGIQAILFSGAHYFFNGRSELDLQSALLIFSSATMLGVALGYTSLLRFKLINSTIGHWAWNYSIYVVSGDFFSDGVPVLSCAATVVGAAAQLGKGEIAPSALLSAVVVFCILHSFLCFRISRSVAMTGDLIIRAAEAVTSDVAPVRCRVVVIAVATGSALACAALWYIIYRVARLPFELSSLIVFLTFSGGIVGLAVSLAKSLLSCKAKGV